MNWQKTTKNKPKIGAMIIVFGFLKGTVLTQYHKEDRKWLEEYDYFLTIDYAPLFIKSISKSPWIFHG